MKRFKNRLRNRLSNKLLETFMHVSINGPETVSEDTTTLRKEAEQSWYESKDRRKLPRLPVGKIEMDNENIPEPGHNVETHVVSTQAYFESDELKTLEQTFQKVFSILRIEKLRLQSTKDDSNDKEEENHADYELEIERVFVNLLNMMNCY